MKLKKYILSFAIVLIASISYGQSKTTYSFNTVHMKDMTQGVNSSEKNVGNDCTLIINTQKNTYTFSYTGNNKVNYEFSFKLFKKGGETFATVVGDDAPKKTEYKVISNLDNKGTIQLIPVKNIQNSNSLTFK
ncbi:MAG: hypothetical protein JXQ93_05345 [Flavobacteriaceae bacterium]